MEYIVLASGSSGNATLIGFEQRYLLIDCGIGKRFLKKRLEQLGISVEQIDGVLITHSHTDHLLSAEQLESVFGLEKIFASLLTYNSLDANSLDPLAQYQIGPFSVFTIPLSHDTPTLGFVIVAGTEKLVYMTDTGYVHGRLYPLIRNADHYLMEFNYDEQMLMDSGRPRQLISRIVSPNGHLSNDDAGEILQEVVGEATKTVTLMHISLDCNSKEVALAVARKYLSDRPDIKIQASNRYEEERVREVV